MARRKILALILAGGKGSRLDVLTEQRAKPAMPFAGTYRLIDFALSNCMHSGLSDVWVIEQYRPHSLNDHLASGRPWDLDRSHGGLRVLPPYQGSDEEGFARGNADAIYRHMTFLREFDPDILLVLSADHLYRMDYMEAIDAHLDHRADATVVTTEVPLQEAGRFGTVEVDERSRVTDFRYKPDDPRSGIVTAEIFIYDAPTLFETLDSLVEEGSGEGMLHDFGDELLPKLVERGRTYAYPLDGYWKDVGTIESYWGAHMDLLAPTPALAIDDRDWPMLTPGPQRLPARIHRSARIDNSLIAPGCSVAGEVARSVLAPGVVVEKGAVVRDSVVLAGTVIGAGAHVINAIIDEDVTVGAGATIGVEGKGGMRVRRERGSAITVIGRRRTIGANARVPAGGRMDPESEE